MPMKAYYMSPEGALRRSLSREELTSAFHSKHGLLWVDIEGTTEEDGRFLEQGLGFHQLPVEDCVNPGIHAPKVDDFGDYLFVIVHGINYAAEADIVETMEMELFIGAHFVVSNHNFPLHSVEAVQRLVEEEGRLLRRGSDFLAYALIDALVDSVLPTIDRMGEFADAIEDEAIYRPQRATLAAVMKLKRSALRLHRVMAPQRDLLNRLSRREFPLIRDEALIFYRDIYDHIVRIEDLNQSLRERADHAMATYLSSVANRQNETMKLLSIVASIFMPMTLVAGIYGMNFENMPELKWPWGYYAVLGMLGAIAVATIAIFWAQRWVTWGRRQVARVRPFAVEAEKLIEHLSGDVGRRTRLRL
ncbi:MAG: magnesium/cobalt transporter CorA [Chloroflexi bacterium]|nr:magnesium/cobalt transporter CorA [Chloroflexota bacterium]